MNKGCLLRAVRAFAVLYACVCVVVFLLPVGGCATQRVLNMTDGRIRGTEAFLPPETVAQTASGDLVMSVVCRSDAVPLPVAFETVVAATNLLSLTAHAPRRTSDGVPLVDIISCIRAGSSRWLDEVPANAAARFAACPWQQNHQADGWYVTNAIVHTVRLENRPMSMALRGRSHYYEEWAAWTTPLQYVLLVPATCWDVLTAVVQIPCYLAGDLVHATISLGDPGQDNPWRELERVRRFPSPRLCIPQERRVSVTPEADDDIQFGVAEWMYMNANCAPEAADRRRAAMAAYNQYLLQLPYGRHVCEATNKLAQLRNAEDEELFCRVQESIAGLKAFIETHPASLLAANAKAKLAIKERHVTVKVKPPQDSGEAPQQGRGPKTFVVGITRLDAIEASIGAGIPIEQPKAPGARGYRWDLAYYRDAYIPYERDYPGKELPVRPLVLVFDTRGILLEIDGD